MATSGKSCGWIRSPPRAAPPPSNNRWLTQLPIATDALVGSKEGKMTYFEGFVAPVPEANKEEYRKHAASAAAIFREFGIRRHVEAWDSDIPEGKVTDFRKAVEAKDDEKVVFAWFEYPDRQTR